MRKTGKLEQSPERKLMRAVGRPVTLHYVNVEDLTFPVESAGGACDVTGCTAATFRAGLQQRFAPAIGAPAHALLHFRRSAFGHCHGEMGRLGLVLGVFQPVEGSPSAVPLLGGRDIYNIPRGVVHC